MTSAREAKGLLNPLLEAHHELVWFPQAVRKPDVAVLLAPPVDHLWKTIHIETKPRRGQFRLLYRIGVVANPSYAGERYSTRHVGPPNGFDVWRTPPEGFGDQVARKIEDVILPVFRRIETLRDLLDLESVDPPQFWGPCVGGSSYARFVIHAAMNEFEAAEAVWFDKIPIELAEFPSFPPPSIYFGLEADLLPLVRARNRAGVARLLRAWEEAEIDRLGMRPWWRPTPYPVGLAA